VGRKLLLAWPSRASGDPDVVLGKPVTGRLTPLIAGVVALLVGLGTGLFVAIAALLGRRRTKSA